MGQKRISLPLLWRRPGTDLNRNHHDRKGKGGSYQNDRSDEWGQGTHHCQTKQNPSRNTRVKQSQVTTRLVTYLVVELPTAFHGVHLMGLEGCLEFSEFSLLFSIRAQLEERGSTQWWWWNGRPWERVEELTKACLGWKREPEIKKQKQKKRTKLN